MFTLFHLILVALVCFVLGSVAVAVYHGKSLKDAIAAEVAALKSDIAAIKAKIDPASSSSISTTQPIKGSTGGSV